MVDPATKAAVRHERAKIVAKAAMASVIGACILGAVLIYSIHEEGTPAGQANLKEREETRRFNKQKEVELEQIKLERAKLEAAQAAKEN